MKHGLYDSLAVLVTCGIFGGLFIGAAFFDWDWFFNSFLFFYRAWLYDRTYGRKTARIIIGCMGLVFVALGIQMVFFE